MRERRADSSGVRVWLVLMKAHRSMVRHAMRSTVTLDMCISDFAVLEVLLHKGPQSVGEIGRRVDLTSGSITNSIDRLEKRGLVARAAHASDRRARVVDLTPDGKAGKCSQRTRRPWIVPPMACRSRTRHADQIAQETRHDGRAPAD